MNFLHCRRILFFASYKTEITRKRFYLTIKKIITFKLILLGFFLSACATKPTAPTKQYVQIGYAYEERIPQVKNIGILNDVCLVRDAVGSDDYFSVGESMLAEAFMLDSAKKYLEQKGYIVDTNLSPFVCAFMTPDKVFKVSDNQGEKVIDRHSPFITSESISNDKEYSKSLIYAITQVLKAVEQKQKAPSDRVFFDDEAIKSFQLIAERTNKETILFLVGRGVIVPGGKSFGQGMATGLLTTIATMGMVTYTHYNVSYLDTYAGLVDLKHGEMLWSNSFRDKKIDPTGNEYYSSRWANTALYYIPTREDSPQTNK